jgi:cyclopropane-fatty-acyl-phospholipid synthase
MSASTPVDYTKIVPPEDNRLYHAYNLEEDVVRSSAHYEIAPEFFYTLTGGEWNCYSCSLWESGFDMTRAQERKLDQFAELLELKPGMHVLDVGCGWGGPIVYLCKKYGVVGHGITITARQIPEAEARAKRYGVHSQFDVMHWKHLPEVEAYDAILSDEVIVHFHDLEQFFDKCWKILKPGRVMTHKELHLTHSRYSALGPLGQHVNKVYGFTGNYRTLTEELQMVDACGFELQHVIEIPIRQYMMTMDEWLTNLFKARERLKAITSEQAYKDYRAYLKAYRYIFTTGHLRLDFVASRKLTDLRISR